MPLDQQSQKIDHSRLPRHIAIIMDGNGRWAKKKSLPRIAGHYEGVKAVDRVVTFCRETGIEALTLYSFSSENWRRPQDEIGALMKILKDYVVKELSRMIREDIRLNVIGALDDLPAFAREPVADAIEKTKNNKGMILTLALSYGSRKEMIQAVKKIGQDLLDGVVKIDDIDEDTFSSRLDTFDLPEPDLLIRTSGEVRISNFLLWQIAYTELYFTEKLWPDFAADEMTEALAAYQQRERRYGKTTEQINKNR